MRKQFLLALLPVLGLTAALYLLFGSERPLRLVELAEAPRPPPEADPSTSPLTLSGLLDEPTAKGNALRKRRNELAQAHREAIEQWRAGRLSMREVEGLEMQLVVLRGQVGEIEKEDMHARLAILIMREVKRLEQLHTSMRAGVDQVERARLYAARESHLAGFRSEPTNGQDYETMRAAYLERVRERHKRLIDVGVGNRESLKMEYGGLEDEFPPVAP